MSAMWDHLARDGWWWRRGMVAACLLSVCHRCDADAQAPKREPALVTQVFRIARNENADQVVMRNGDRYSGAMGEREWGLETRSGPLKLERTDVAGIQFGVDGEPDLVVTVNDNRLAGRIGRLPTPFALAGGPAMELDAGNIHRIVCRLGADERNGLPARQFVRLRSGEAITGRVSPDPLTIRTATGEVFVARSELAFMGMGNEQRPYTRAVLRDDRVVDGELLNETLEIELDIGQNMRVSVEDVDVMMGPDGQRPCDPEQRDGVQVVRVSSTAEVNVHLRGESESGGLRVTEVADDSPFHGAIEPGDLIVKVAGASYDEGALTRMVWDMLIGNRDQVDVGFVREGRMEQILLMRQVQASKAK